MGLDSLWAAFDEDPADHAAFLDLFKALRDEREHEQLVSMYRARAEEVDEEEAVFLFMTVAEVWSQRLGMPGLATEALFAAFERVPDTTGLRTSLQQHLVQQLDWNMMARLMALELYAATEPTTRGGVLMRFGHLLNLRLHDVSEAAAMFADAAQSTPSLRTAGIVALRRLVEAEPNVAEPLKRLRKLAPHDTSAAEQQVNQLTQSLDTLNPEAKQQRASLMCKLASALLALPEQESDVLSLLDTAWNTDRSCHRSVEDLLWTLCVAMPTRVDVAQALLKRARDRSTSWDEARWREFADVVNLGTLLTDDVEAQFDLTMVLGWLEGMALRDPESATQTYLRAVRIDRHRDREVQDALARLFEHHPKAQGIRDALLELVRASRRTQGLAEFWRMMSELSEDQPDQVVALWQRARLLLEQEQDPDSALELFREAVARADRSQADRFETDLLSMYDDGVVRGDVVQVVRLLAVRFDRWETLSEVLWRHADRERDPEEKASILGELSDILANRLDRLDEAAQALNEALVEQPESLTLIHAMRKLAVRRGDVSLAQRWFAKEMRMSAQPEERQAILLARARFEADKRYKLDAVTSIAELLLVPASPPEALKELVLELFDGPHGLKLLNMLRKLAVLPLHVHAHARRLEALGKYLMLMHSDARVGLGSVDTGYKRGVLTKLAV